MTLSDYISERFDGNVAAFARAMGRRQSTVRRWLLPPEHKDYRSPMRAAQKIFLVSNGAVLPPDLAPPLPAMPAVAHGD